MDKVVTRNSSRRTVTWLAALLIALLVALPLPTQAVGAPQIPGAANDNRPNAIPFDQIGVEADRQANGSNLGIEATAAGAELRAVFQDLAGSLTTEGLWLRSTVEETADAPFRVMATAISRGLGVAQPLADTGVVAVEPSIARFVRPDLIEEYSVSTDGVRQDFLLLNRPDGAGPLRVDLAVDGATAEAAGDTVTLVLDGSGRKLAYSRLYVSDANGRTLAAHLEAPAAHRIAIVVDDTAARWPLRIDPTFSDVDWISMSGSSGVNNTVWTLAVSGSDLYVGGEFTTVGVVSANRIAKWNGSAWSALGTGVSGGPVGGVVWALAMIGSDLYVGGSFTTAGGVSANNIAKWDGSAWSALGAGLNNYVAALAVSGSDLYVGGDFSTAGGASAAGIAKWNGSTWSTLGSGMNNVIEALVFIGSDLYAGGYFTTAGGATVNRIAKWNGSTWSALGAGVSNQVYALAVSGSDLYAGGSFTAAGGGLAARIAKWDGSAWSPLGSGLDNVVRTLAVVGSDLYVGGQFTRAGGKNSPYLA